MRFAIDVASKFRDGVMCFLTLMSPYSSSPRVSIMRFTPRQAGDDIKQCAKHCEPFSLTSAFFLPFTISTKLSQFVWIFLLIYRTSKTTRGLKFAFDLPH